MYCLSHYKFINVLLLSLFLAACGGGGGAGDAEMPPNADNAPGNTQTGNDQTNDEQAGDDATGDDPVTDDQPDNEQPEQPDTDPPAEEQPVDDQPADEQPTDDPSDNDSPPTGTGHCGMVPALADTSLVTATATQTGTWTNPDTWGGVLPADGDVVQIPEGIEVSLASMLSARIKTLRVDGTLRFSPTDDTQLQVDTLVSTCSGTLEIGSQTNPIQSGTTAKVVFIDNGAVSDPNLISRGALLMGQTTIHGATKTHRAIISPQAQQGDITLTLTSAPSGWEIGDQLVITGTQPNNPESDEIRTIQSISGTQVTLNNALTLDHTAPQADLNVYVANTTRNVEFISENAAIPNRGHIMFMSANVDVRNARFTELGRTDKTQELDDFAITFPDDGAGDDAPATATATALGGTNIRGRYALHFHQLGTDASTTPAHVSGSVVFNGPGWGFVNHSSHVNFIDNVSYGLQGAGFYTEAGDEIGTMQGNIAIRSVNSNFVLDHEGAIDPDLGADRMDYGNDGDGFWLTGNRVSLINNVAAGASAHGFIYWTDGIMEISGSTATRVTVAVNSLPNGNLIPNRDTVPVWWAPLAESSGNESYGSTIGFRARYIHADNYLGREGASDFHQTPPQAYVDTLTPSFNNLTVWGNRDGVLLNYNERVSLYNTRIVGFGRDQSTFQENDGTAKTGVGFDIGTDATHGPGTVENVTIEGFGAGFVTPVNGLWTIRNVTISQNDTDLFVPLSETSPTQVQFENVTYSSFIVQDGDGATELPAHIVESP